MLLESYIRMRMSLLEPFLAQHNGIYSNVQHVVFLSCLICIHL